MHKEMNPIAQSKNTMILSGLLFQYLATKNSMGNCMGKAYKSRAFEVIFDFGSPYFKDLVHRFLASFGVYESAGSWNIKKCGIIK